MSDTTTKTPSPWSGILVAVLQALAGGLEPVAKTLADNLAAAVGDTSPEAVGQWESFLTSGVRIGTRIVTTKLLPKDGTPALPAPVPGIG